jgi:hypothetical protein
MNEHNDEISLKELIGIVAAWYFYLLSKWKIIVLAGIIGAVLGYAYSLNKKPIYTATLSFALEDDKSGGLGGALGLASSFGLDMGGSSGGMFAGSNLTELFKSRSMVEQTLMLPVTVGVDTISLAEMYIGNHGWREKWKESAKLKGINFSPNRKRSSFTRVHDSILGVIYNDLTKNYLTVAQKDKKAGLLSIEVVAPDELFAKYFSEALAKIVSDFYIETKSRKSQINMAILEKQTDSIRRELNGAITGVAVANDKNFNLNPAMNVRLAPSARRQVDVQANTAILTELVKQSELAKVTLRKETPLIQIIDRPILPLPKEVLRKSKAIFVGGFLVGFLTIMVLIIKRFLRNLI